MADDVHAHLVATIPKRLVPYIESICSLWTTSKYSDLIIKSGGRKWRVHRSIVCARSKVFAKMCDIGMKESQEGVISLEDDDPDVVEAMLKDLYYFDYSNETMGHKEPGGATIPLILLDVRVHSIADKYDIQPLMTVAAEKFSIHTQTEWKTKAFAEAVHEIYTAAPDPTHELRDTVVAVCSKHAQEWYSEEFGIHLREVAETVAPFASAVAKSLSGSASAPDGVRPHNPFKYPNLRFEA